MKRPFLTLGVVITFVAISVAFVGRKVLLPLVALSAIGIGLSFLLKRKSQNLFKQMAFVLSAVFLLCLVQIFNHTHYIEKIESLTGQGVITGRVVGEPEVYKDYSILYVKTESVGIENAPQNLHLNLFVTSDYDVNPDDTFVSTVEFVPLDSKDVKYNYPERVFVDCNTITFEKTENDRPHTLRYHFLSVKNFVEDRFDALFTPKEASILKGILLGDTNSMNSELKEVFIRCGVIHVMSVSGLHISVISQFIFLFLGLFGLSKRKCSVITILCVIAIIFITGAEPSVVRAGIMNIVALLGILLLRQTDGLNSLGLSVFAILFFNIYYITDISFMLSVLSFLGIIVFAPRISWSLLSKFKKESFLKDVMTVVIKSGAQSLAASIFTFPVMAIVFGGISTVSVIANFVINWHVTLLIVLAILSVCLGTVPILSDVIVFVLKQLILYIEVIMSALATPEISFVEFDKLSATVFVCISLILIAIWMIFSERLRLGYLVATITAIAISLIISHSYLDYNKVQFTVNREPDAISVSVSYKNESLAIVNEMASGEKTSSNYLSYNEKYVTLNKGSDNKNIAYDISTNEYGTLVTIHCADKTFLVTNNAETTKGMGAAVVVTSDVKEIKSSEKVIYLKYKESGEYANGEYCFAATDSIIFEMGE